MRDTMLVISPDTNLAVLIARTLRYRQIYCTLLPYGVGVGDVSALEPKGIIFAAEENAANKTFSLDDSLLHMGVPVLALSGMAVALCRQLGGNASEPTASGGSIDLSLNDEALFHSINGGERMLHALSALALPESLNVIAKADDTVIGFKYELLSLYALQYPIERNDPDAAQLLYNFASGICGCEAIWDDDFIIDQALSCIREAANDGRVLCAVSGGVDSAVCAKLAQLALGGKLSCVFVDTGLFRRDEPEDVLSIYSETMGIDVRRIDARDVFLRALSGVSGSDDKERISSAIMTQVLLKQLSCEPEIKTLLMGTNLNDTLYGFSPSAETENALNSSALKVCEPIRQLFKDEIRRLAAAALGLPASVAERRPFPASGLALRVMGKVTEEHLNVLREADACFMREIIQGGYEKRLWQYYATLVESMDDPSQYTVCLRALQAVQGGANAARLPFDVLERVMESIFATVSGVNRVVYDLTPSSHYGKLE